MKRVFALLLVAPLLANCSDSTTPVAPSVPSLALEVSPVGAWESPSDELPIEAWEAAFEASPLQGAPSSGEVMVFGNPGAGTSYPPGAHDQSFHGRDRIIPGTVVIDAGQTVTFQMNPGHRVAIYNDGTRPQDIQPNPGPFVLYPTGRLFLQPAPVPQFTLRFTQPGKYLVICAISNHFFGANMWGWVIVR